MGDQLETPRCYPVLELGAKIFSIPSLAQKSNDLLSFSSGDGLAALIFDIDKGCFAIVVKSLLLISHLALNTATLSHPICESP